MTTRNYAPQLVKTTTQVSNFSKSRQVHVVCFAQTHRAIPIFGTRAVVEVDDSGKLIAAQAKLANVTGVSPTPDADSRQSERGARRTDSSWPPSCKRS